MQQFEAQKLIEVDAMKSRFFANISHEFRTPITLILGPIEKMLSRHQDMASQHDLNIMQRNARRLLRLINQLLDLSKLEAGRMKLQARVENIVDLVNRFVQLFESQAKLKGINLQFSAEKKGILIYVDREKIENIIYNLVANALKFTPDGGTVIVNVRERDQEYVQITVSDSGPGIAQDQLERVFDRFYQVDDSKTRQHEGTGIGLALTKELVELHRGKISVVSSDLGSTFTVLLPLGKEHLTADEIAAEDIAATAQPEVDLMSAESTILKDVSPQPATMADRSAPRLLIVEDNADLRAFMREVLQPAYQIKDAADGRQGIELALKMIPDLIISDVMMPGCDGFELCRILKTDERTSHIPIILLTARASIESKVEGLETGADDYIIKPFDERELKARVANLIELRRKLRQRFRLGQQESEMDITSMDDKFLKRAKEIINSHMTDSDFTIDIFARQVGFGKTQLYRKIKALTDFSPHLYIRFLRLQHAASLLKSRADNITQVSYQVGFNSPAHFAKAFRRQFGMSPSDFVRQADARGKSS